MAARVVQGGRANGIQVGAYSEIIIDVRKHRYVATSDWPKIIWRANLFQHWIPFILIVIYIGRDLGGGPLLAVQGGRVTRLSQITLAYLKLA